MLKLMEGQGAIEERDCSTWQPQVGKKGMG